MRTRRASPVSFVVLLAFAAVACSSSTHQVIGATTTPTSIAASNTTATNVAPSTTTTPRSLPLPSMRVVAPIDLASMPPVLIAEGTEGLVRIAGGRIASLIPSTREADAVTDVARLPDGRVLYGTGGGDMCEHSSHILGSRQTLPLTGTGYLGAGSWGGQAALLIADAGCYRSPGPGTIHAVALDGRVLATLESYNAMHHVVFSASWTPHRIAFVV